MKRLISNRIAVKRLIVLALACCGGLLLYFHNPQDSKIIAPCPFHYLTGLYCPGCGSMRGLHNLLHGNIFKVFDYNPLMVLSMPLIIYLLLAELEIKIKGKILFPKKTFSSFFYIALLVIIIVFLILKKIKIEPFIFLAP